MSEKLLDYHGLSEALGLPVRTLRHLTSRGVIPHLRLGHKLVRFQPSRVEKALLRREVRAANWPRVEKALENYGIKEVKK
jgi:excisionase family DNA binding protein